MSDSGTAERGASGRGARGMIPWCHYGSDVLVVTPRVGYVRQGGVLFWQLYRLDRRTITITILTLT